MKLKFRVVFLLIIIAIFTTVSAWADSYIEFGPKIHSTDIGRINGVPLNLPMFGVAASFRTGLLEQELPLPTNTSGLTFLGLYLDFETAFLFAPLTDAVEIRAGLLSWLIGAGIRLDLVRIRGDSFWFSIYNKEHLTFRTGRDIESSVDIGISVFGGLGLDFDEGIGVYFEAGANPISFLHNTSSVGATLGMSIRL